LALCHAAFFRLRKDQSDEWRWRLTYGATIGIGRSRNSAAIHCYERVATEQHLLNELDALHPVSEAPEA